MFKILRVGSHYCVDLYDVYFPISICKILDISVEHYNNILINNGAISICGYLVFDSEENTKNAINDLEIYLIMSKLAGM